MNFFTSFFLENKLREKNRNPEYRNSYIYYQYKEKKQTNREINNTTK